MVVAHVQTANLKSRFGLLDSTNDPPSNGVYFEADTTLAGTYRCVCAAGGVSTVATTSIPISSTRREFFIFYAPGSAVFMYRNSGDKVMTLLATVTSNLPTSAMAPVYWIKTLSAASCRMDVYSHKFAFPDEV